MLLMGNQPTGRVPFTGRFALQDSQLLYTTDFTRYGGYSTVAKQRHILRI